MSFHKSIHLICTKTIAIRAQGHDKCRISVILSICSNGDKLKPIIILKGANNRKIYKNIIISDIKNNKCIIVWNKKA